MYDARDNMFGTIKTGKSMRFNNEVVRPERFELPTFWFVARRSIQLSYERTVYFSRDFHDKRRERILSRESRPAKLLLPACPTIAFIPNPQRSHASRQLVRQTPLNHRTSASFKFVPCCLDFKIVADNILLVKRKVVELHRVS